MRVLGLALLLWVLPATPQARLLVTREQGLARVYGDSARVETRTIYLRQDALDSLAAHARAPMDQARITYYEVHNGETLAGLAFVDKHVVRTATESVLICLQPDGSVRAVEILAWNEPEDYLPSRRWLETASGAQDPKTIRPGHDVPRIAGATLSAQAITAAIRRALVLGKMILGERARSAAAGP